MRFPAGISLRPRLPPSLLCYPTRRSLSSIVNNSNIMALKLVPNYEVKMLLKPSEVLGSNNKPNDAIISEFDIKSSTKKMNIQFVDTENQDLYAGGWNLRIRKEEGEDGLELTYKKRYPIGEGFSASAADQIDSVVETALQDGFDAATGFEAQVEVGYQKQTLSVSRDVKINAGNLDGMDLPKAKASREVLADKAPTEFKNWLPDNWATKHLTSSVVYGPVRAKRFKGTWDGVGLFIEVWLIRKSKTDATLEPSVEVSFKTKDFQKALEGRAKITESLQRKGWFLPEDSLRTKLIMDRYGGVGE